MVASQFSDTYQRLDEACFNPLHCGAVVASRIIRGRVKVVIKFQSPSLRGSGRFEVARWFRHGSGVCFNPLHCGAVVASADGRDKLRPPGARFNPLHCGAVVASRRGAKEEEMDLFVSIPFIAGQWSLRAWTSPRSSTRCAFQSPSLRGSGRFDPPTRRRRSLSGGFQSPSLRGSGRFKSAPARRRRFAFRFNPLHCGAVVASRGFPPSQGMR